MRAASASVRPSVVRKWVRPPASRRPNGDRRRLARFPRLQLFPGHSVLPSLPPSLAGFLPQRSPGGRFADGELRTREREREEGEEGDREMKGKFGKTTADDDGRRTTDEGRARLRFF